MPGFDPAITADLGPGQTRNLSQGKCFADRLPQVDATLVGDYGAGDVETLRVVAATLAVAQADVGH
ncbi:hypothetical protein D3C77_733270 [compost metagenome]